MADIYYSIKKGSLKIITKLIANYIEVTEPKYNQKTRSYSDIDDVFSFTNDEGGNGFGMVVFHDNYNKDGINYDPEEVLNWLIQGKYLSIEDEKIIMVNLPDETTEENDNTSGEVSKEGEFHDAVYHLYSDDDQPKEQPSTKENGVKTTDVDAVPDSIAGSSDDTITSDKVKPEINVKDVILNEENTEKTTFPTSSVDVTPTKSNAEIDADNWDMLKTAVKPIIITTFPNVNDGNYDLFIDVIMGIPEVKLLVETELAKMREVSPEEVRHQFTNPNFTKAVNEAMAKLMPLKKKQADDDTTTAQINTHYAQPMSLTSPAIKHTTPSICSVTSISEIFRGKGICGIKKNWF